MTQATAPLSVAARELALEYRTRGGAVRALDGADLAIGGAATLGIVGESGSGKTTLGMAIGRLLPASAARAGGDLTISGRSVFGLTKRELRRLRRERLGFVFQNPMTALDPTMRVARQLERASGSSLDVPRREALLARVGLKEAGRVARSYPHELSGGMAQRVVIALAIARGPSLLIADEPTSALDATVRDEVLDLLIGLKRELGTRLVLMSHELRVVAARCDEIAVMYGGRVVEHGAARRLFERPRHPYTMALLLAAPGRERPGQRVAPIPGTPPLLRQASPGCAFAARCAFATEQCRAERPRPRDYDGRTILCHRAEEIAAELR
jgi:peptide/nickel transport system ATP-binding protein